MMAPIQISLFWYTYYYFTAWIRWAVKTGELWISVTRTTGHWSTTEMLRVGGFLVLAGPTTYGRLKTMEASSKWNQIVSTKTHQGKKFRNLIHIRFILVVNSKIKIKQYYFSSILQDSENARLYDYSTGWVYSHGAGLSTLDVRQTLGSLFQSVTQFWFRSVSSIYVYEKKAQSESQTCHLNYGTPFT